MTMTLDQIKSISANRFAKEQQEAGQVTETMFDDLEQYCCDHDIPYIRWSGGCAGSFGPERIVYDGRSGPLNYDVDEDDHVVVHAHTIAQLGSMRAVCRYLKAAEIVLPSLVVTC